MEKFRSNANQPDFGSLAAIMDHFYSVSFEKFQEDLNDWFRNELLEEGMDPTNSNFNGVCNLSSVTDLISKIYHQAELQIITSESTINFPVQGE